MKTRVISGIIMALMGVCAVVFIFTPFIVVFLTLLCAISTYEIMSCAGVKSKTIQIPAIIFSALFPVYHAYGDRLIYSVFSAGAIVAVYAVIMMMLMIFIYKNIRFEQLAISLYASTFIPYSFSGLIMLRDTYITSSSFTKKESVYLVLFAILCAILTDTFAYFVGVNFGKHKLCPAISPKKSVEGAVGGLVLSVAFNILVFLGARAWVFGGTSNISVLFVLVMSFVLSIISMFGDLSASVLKRNFGVKDFGNLIPGHGGIMDRFDSMLFVLPVLTAAVKFIY